MTSIEKNNLTVSVNLNANAPLKKIYDTCINKLKEFPEIQAIGVKGSLIKGTVDQYSDIDLVVFTAEESGIIKLKTQIQEYFSTAFKLLSFFPATHIGMGNLLIFFLDFGDTVLKVDIEIALSSMAASKMEFLLVSDPQNSIPESITAGGQLFYNTPDTGDIYAKFTGWIWYTYTKTERGEITEAIDALHVMRSYAVIPFAQLLHGLPLEGHRYLEKRFPPALVSALLTTYPAAPEKQAVLRALINIAALFTKLAEELSAKQNTPFAFANLEQMIRRVKDAAGSH